MSNIAVNNNASLQSALKSAHAGDTILLAKGVYDGVSIKNLSFGSGITIASADAAHEAVLSNLQVTNVSGVTFRNLEVNVKASQLQGVTVRNSENLHFDQMSLHGSMDGKPTNDRNGFSILNSSDITISNSEFQQLYRGASLGTVSNVVVSGNNLHDMASDGFDFAQASHIDIADNTFSDFHVLNGAHPDAIQFWTKGATQASGDIAITNNLMIRGGGDGFDGVFMGASANLHYEDVTISGNLLAQTGYNTIRLTGVDGLSLGQNTIVSNTDKTQLGSILIQQSHSVHSAGNAAPAISFGNSTGVSQSGDVINTLVNDGGLSALTSWLTSHSRSMSADLLDLVHAQASAGGGAPSSSGGSVTPTAPATPTTPTTPALPSGSSSVGAVAGHSTAITGDAGANKLMGTSAVQTLSGLGGNDTLNGQGGADTLIGGAGNDTYIVPNSAAKIVETAGGGVDTVIARGSHVLEANVENLVIDSSTGNGWSGTGNALDNHITGNAGGNLLNGQAGNDVISGGLGNDVLLGGRGNDHLTGGGGADIFRFARGDGADIITDFGAGGRDAIDASALLHAGIKATLHDVGANTVISFSSGDSMTLLGVHAAELTKTATGWFS